MPLSQGKRGKRDKFSDAGRHCAAEVAPLPGSRVLTPTLATRRAAQIDSSKGSAHRV